MWWQVLIGLAVGSITGAVIYAWGWNRGLEYGRDEGSYNRYIDAMKEEPVE